MAATHYMGEDDKVGVGVGNDCVFFNDALT